MAVQRDVEDVPQAFVVGVGAALGQLLAQGEEPADQRPAARGDRPRGGRGARISRQHRLGPVLQDHRLGGDAAQHGRGRRRAAREGGASIRTAGRARSHWGNQATRPQRRPAPADSVPVAPDACRTRDRPRTDRCVGSASSPSVSSTPADPGPGPRVHARDDRARRAAGLRQRVAARPAPAARDLLAGRRARRGLAAHLADRPRDGRHPARLGEPAAARRGPRDRRRAVRRTAQPGRQRRAADGAGTTSAARSTPTPPTSRTSATPASSGCSAFLVRRAGQHVLGHARHRGLLRPGAAAGARSAASGCGTAARACARRPGPASTR